MAKGENIFKRKDGRWEVRYIKGYTSTADNPGSRTRIVIGTPKSDTSIRTIPITDYTAELCGKMNPHSSAAYVLTGTENYMEPLRFVTRLGKLCIIELLLHEQIGIFRLQALYGGQLFQRQIVKRLLRCLVDEDVALMRIVVFLGIPGLAISNQKRQLEDYARSQGFPNPVHFTDDGISGTCFDRPGFLAMMKEVEAGRVEYLLIKDMSRLGRDYLKVGQIMEILRQKGVRLIAINDGVDSARGDDDFTPFRNIMNEYYARDTSRKIRSTFQSKGKSGKHVTGTVIYGYLWNETRDQWLVDEYSAGIVKRIFAMTIEGMGPYQIASRLKEEKVLIPSAYKRLTA